MRKIGREVLFMSANKESRRKGEGDFIRLKDGRIMYAYTEMLGAEAFDDHHVSQISAIFSSDEGETWGDKKVLVETGEGYLNVMSVSLLRMKNGDLGLFYGKKSMVDGKVTTTKFFTRSNDEGETFSEPIILTKGYYEGSANARAIMTKSGRIILPFNRHDVYDGVNISFKGNARFVASDDDGYTFYDLTEPFTASPSSGLQETGVVEIENGKLFSYSRTTAGSQFESFSTDGGKTWTEPIASEIFYSPGAPMLIRHVCKNKTLAVWNPIPNYPGRKDDLHEWSRRTPMIGMICDGEGENLFNGKNIPMVFEDDDWNSYCYPAIISGDDYFLIAYYHSNNTKLTLNSLKMIKVELKDIYPEEEKKD